MYTNIGGEVLRRGGYNGDGRPVQRFGARGLRPEVKEERDLWNAGRPEPGGESDDTTSVTIHGDDASSVSHSGPSGGSDSGSSFCFKCKK